MPSIKVFGIKLTAEGAEQVEAELDKASKAGKRAGERIRKSTEPASKGMKALDAASREATGSLDNMARRAPAVSRIAKVLGPAGLLGGAAVGGLVALSWAARSAAEEIAAIGDAADRAGIDVDLYERLKAALTLEGQTSNGLEASLSSFVRKIGEARAGLQEPLKVFRALGVAINNEDGSSKTTTQVLRDVSDALSLMTDKTQQLAVSQKLFEEGGKAVLMVIDDGTAAMDKQFGAAERIGLLYGGELIRNAQEINATFGKQAEVIKTQLNAAFIDAAPLVMQLTEQFVRGLPVILAFIQKVGEAVGFLAAPLSDQLADRYNEQNQLLDRRAESVRQMEATFGENLSSTEIQEIASRNLLSAGGRGVISARAVVKADELLATLDEQIKQIEMAQVQAEARRKAIEASLTSPITPEGLSLDLGSGGGGGGAIREQIEDYQKLLEASRARTAALQAEGESIGRNTQEVAFLEERERLLSAAIKEGLDLNGPATDEFYQNRREELSALAATYASTSVAIERSKAAMQVGQQAADALKGGLRDVLSGAKSLNEGVAGVLQNIASRLMDMALNPVFDILTAKFSGIMDGGGGIMGAIGTLFGFGDGGSLKGPAPGGFADGGALQVGGRAKGLLQGQGGPREDNILFWGSKGEFMQPAHAVEFYGMEFMERLRRLQVPKFSGGGPISTMPHLARQEESPGAQGGGVHLAIEVNVDGDVENAGQKGNEIAAAIASRLPGLIDERIAHQLRPSGMLADRRRY